MNNRYKITKINYQKKHNNQKNNNNLFNNLNNNKIIKKIHKIN